MSKNNLFHNAPAWVFVTTVIILIGSTSDFSSLVLDFFPSWACFRGWIKLCYLILAFFILVTVWWKNEKPQLQPDTVDHSSLKIHDYRFIYWTQVCKGYLFNIISFKIFPLFICWIISWFIKKDYKPYGIISFKPPEYWPKYREMIHDFFPYMFRVYIKNLDQNFEVKFGRDFQRIELRWTEPDDDIFTDKRNESYQNVFCEDKLKNIKIFTWITPFGLYWNLRRLFRAIKIRVYKFLMKN